MANFIENLVRKGAGLHEGPLPTPVFPPQNATPLGRGGMERGTAGFDHGSPFEPGSETDARLLSNERGESRIDRTEEPLTSPEYGLRRAPGSDRTPEKDGTFNAEMTTQERVQTGEISPDSPEGLSLSSDRSSKPLPPGTGRKSDGVEIRTRTVESSKREPVSVVLTEKRGSEESSIGEREWMGTRTRLQEEPVALQQRVALRPMRGASESQREVELKGKTGAPATGTGDETGPRPLRMAPENDQGEATPILMPQVGPSARMEVERLMAKGDRSSFRGRDEASQNSGEVRVSIGRIEIKTPPPIEATSDSPVRDFDHYLMERVYFDPHHF
jgi:hypothetical protein